MKKFLLMSVAVLIVGCAGKQSQKAAIRDSLMQMHEKVMATDEQATTNHMKLDTLLKQAALPGKDTALMLNKKLIAASDSMGAWMNHFQEKTGQSDEAAIAYLRAQKKLITVIDSQLNAAVKQSNEYLKKVKSK